MKRRPAPLGAGTRAGHLPHCQHPIRDCACLPFARGFGANAPHLGAPQPEPEPERAGGAGGAGGGVGAGG
eukprot:7652407-Pyramimonas_sp.AAC.1